MNLMDSKKRTPSCGSIALTNETKEMLEGFYFKLHIHKICFLLKVLFLMLQFIQRNVFFGFKNMAKIEKAKSEQKGAAQAH